MKPTSMSLATRVQLKEGDDIDSVAKSALTTALDNADHGYRKIRHRFLDVFVREHMGGATAEGREHIRHLHLQNQEFLLHHQKLLLN
jgi:hypothetical protein